MKLIKPCTVTVITIILVLIFIGFGFMVISRSNRSGISRENYANCKMRENLKVYGGNPTCPYRTDESCPYLKKGTGPTCQINKKKVGCPPCCGNIDWYLGPQEYFKKCGKSAPPAFPDLKDYYASIQENFISENNID